MAQLSFDASKVAPAQPLTPLPDGWFPVVITESEIKPTKNGDGQRIPLTLQVCEGHPYAKRKVFDGLNIVNPNPVAQQIAQEQLSAICHAVGVIQLQDTNQLHGIPLLVKLSTTARREDTVTGKVYEPRNEVKGYAKVGTQEVNMDPPKQAAAAAAPAAPAWANQAPPAQQPAPQQQAPAPAAQQQPAAAQPAWATNNQPAAQPAQPGPQAQPVPEGNGPWQQQPAQTPTPEQTSSTPPTTEASTAPQSSAPSPSEQAPTPEVPPWARGSQG